MALTFSIVFVVVTVRVVRVEPSVALILLLLVKKKTDSQKYQD